MTVYRGPVRVIARLDVKGPNLIKGIQFDGHRVLGVPEFFAKTYSEEGIDELIFQDSVASLYRRNSLLDIIQQTASEVFIPITVAGGLRSIEDIRQTLRAGADKVAINTEAIQNPQLIKQASETFGSQCIVAQLDVYRYKHGACHIWTDYGREESGVDAFEWAEQVVELGAGEILLSSINEDGLGRGFDLELTEKIAKKSKVPVIASCGAGNEQHMADAVLKGKADAVAAASIFHYNYCQKINKLNMQFDEAKLRMGEHIDSGNIDFLNFGYGGFDKLTVTPTSIPKVKEHMSYCKIPIRKLS